MDDLFTPYGTGIDVHPDTRGMPLAARMRPETLEEVAGQKHLLGKGKLLRRAIETDRFSSLIFYGPPGVGKTTLAYVIARQTSSYFVMLNGVESNVGEIRDKIAEAKTRFSLHGQKTILFVDELHRFNKAQQDVLLPHLERGTVRFIGATTENPFFAINSAMLSRSQVFPLEPVAADELEALLRRAKDDPVRGLGKMPLIVDEEALQHLALKADGDARKALTALEVAALSTPPEKDGRIIITLSVAEESIQQKALRYDRAGDGHYDTISAFIKSMRGSDPDAALYWLAFMLNAGEDIRFIARRLVICASEDVGLADSNALRVAVAAARAAEMVGMPEARIPLAHATVYTWRLRLPRRMSKKEKPLRYRTTWLLPRARNSPACAAPQWRKLPTNTPMILERNTTFPKRIYLRAAATITPQTMVWKAVSPNASIIYAGTSLNRESEGSGGQDFLPIFFPFRVTL